jgi:hypothetical protein
MKNLTAAHTLVAARASLTIAALALASCAADDPTSKQEIAGLTKAAPTMSANPSAGEQPCSGHQSHTLLLKGTDGQVVRLVHVSGCGWKHAADSRPAQEGGLALSKMSFSPVAASHAETTTATGDPLAVFIDGPTGYTFIWTSDTGWKFVGQLSDEAH